MTPTEVKENLTSIPAIKTALDEIKALFSIEKKVEAPVEVVAEPAKVEVPAETKVEFNHEEFTKEYNAFKSANEATIKSFEEKFVAFEASLSAANETIAKQDEMLKKTFALVEKVLEAPVAMSAQKKKDGVKVNMADALSKESIEKFRADFKI
jgi:hypothetical protein